MNIEWIGMIAGALTTCAFVPQVVKTVRSRSTGDLSWLWLVMMSVYDCFLTYTRKCCIRCM